MRKSRPRELPLTNCLADRLSSTSHRSLLTGSCNSEQLLPVDGFVPPIFFHIFRLCALVQSALGLYFERASAESMTVMEL